MSEKNPFQLLDTKDVYSNPWIHVVEHKVITPGGKPGIYGVVRFKNRAIGVVPYENGRIWLVGQYRVPLGEYSWEIPEGGAPYSEDPLAGAKRELREEMGFAAHSWDLLFKMHLSNSVTNEEAIVYLARRLEKGAPLPEDTEVFKYKSLTLDEAFTQVVEGKITDSMTVAAIFRIKLMKVEGSL
jgi:8-oxo-dGTP pyrophosphatase MutT (NUDIX family)